MQLRHMTEDKPPAPRTPDLYVVGAQKAGTTWLQLQLVDHPAMWSPALKEPQYFCDVAADAGADWLRQHRREEFGRLTARAAGRRLPAGHPLRPSWLARLRRSAPAGYWTEAYLDSVRRLLAADDRPVDDAWYAALFDGCPPGRRAFEASPTYATLSAPAIARMRGLSPDARIILMLREPVGRAWSFLRMQLSFTGDFSPDAQLAALARHADWLRATSDYPGTLARYRAAFGAERVLVADYARIRAEPFALLRDICGFLGVGFRPAWFPEVATVFFEGPAAEMAPALRDGLRRLVDEFADGYARTLPALSATWNVPA